MEIGNLFKLSRKTFFNPGAWIGSDALKSQHGVIKENLRTVFTIEKPTREETFEEALSRLNLSEEDVKQKIRVCSRYVAIFFVTGWIVFFYTFYLLFRYKVILPWILGMSASAILFSQAFRFHFWVFQMREQKLGMTFKAWLNSVLGVKRASP